MKTTESQWTDIESLTIEEIDNLLPQLSAQLEKSIKEAEANQPIKEKIETKFSEVWKGVKNELTEEFNAVLAKEEAEFSLEEGFRIILRNRIGEDNTKLFFSVLRKCLKSRNFKSTHRFYQRVKDSEVNTMAKAAFAVYRFNLSSVDKDPNLGGKWIKEEVSRIKRSSHPTVSDLVGDFTEVGFL